MKKVLLIDDRPDRHLALLKDASVTLNNYLKDVLNIVLKNEKNESYNTHKEMILEKKMDFLDEYSTVIVHRSAFEEENIKVIENLKSSCEEKNIKTVLFSGGISASFYTNSKQEVLLLNSRMLYSKKLEIFLDACKIDDNNILLLAYGNRWKDNLLLNCLEKINYYQSFKYPFDFDEFVDETGIDTIMDIISYTEPKEEDFDEFVKELRNSIINEVAFNE
ncbi:hypothetical protein [Aliarcobacter butzleri]|uniref:hypothetical protein n=1 Tax=Aliarcobacter butzleri TaxID=28197 RepID=UPI003AF62D6A